MKTNYIIASILMVFIFLSFQTNAQSDRKYNKIMVKDYKQKIKELEKDDWKVSGSSLSIEAAVMQHRRKVNQNESNKEMIVSVTMCKSLNVCKANALNNALREYADNAGSYVRGRVTSDMFGNSSADVPEEFDRFYAAYERLVSSEIKGELQFSLGLEKENGEGKSYQAWYIINEENAHKARLRAMQQAAAETKLAQEYANQVSNFVQEGFDK